FSLFHVSTVRTLSSVVVDLAAVCGANNGDHQFGIEYVIDYAVLANPDTPCSLLAGEFFDAVGSRIFSQIFDRVQHAGTCWTRKLFYLACCSRGELDAIAHEADSARSSARDTRSPASSAFAAR